MASFEDFQKVEMRIGKIVDVMEFPEAKKPSYRLIVDFGKFGLKKSSAQLCSNYKKEELVGRLVVAVTNFQPKQIGNFMSEALVMGVPDNDGECILLRPDKEPELGARVY